MRKKASSPTNPAPNVAALANPARFKNSLRLVYRFLGVISDDGMKLESLFFNNIDLLPTDSRYLGTTLPTPIWMALQPFPLVLGAARPTKSCRKIVQSTYFDQDVAHPRHYQFICKLHIPKPMRDDDQKGTTGPLKSSILFTVAIPWSLHPIQNSVARVLEMSENRGSYAFPPVKMALLPQAR